MTIDDSIIIAYKNTPQEERDSAEFREVARQFNAVFRRSVNWGIFSGLIETSPQTSGFWNELIESAPDE